MELTEDEQARNSELAVKLMEEPSVDEEFFSV